MVLPDFCNYRKDILEECQIDTSSIKTYQDLTDVYEKIKEKHPEMVMMASQILDLHQM